MNTIYEPRIKVAVQNFADDRLNLRRHYFHMEWLLFIPFTYKESSFRPHSFLRSTNNFEVAVARMSRTQSNIHRIIAGSRYIPIPDELLHHPVEQICEPL